jgi:hypothetical protein
MDTIRYDSPACRYIAEHLGSEFFTLIDVGCAYGLAHAWQAFGDRLRAIGFDANVSEIDRPPYSCRLASWTSTRLCTRSGPFRIRTQGPLT